MAVLVERAKGALNNKGGRGQRNREEIGAGATWTWTFLFSRGFAARSRALWARVCGFAAQSCSRQNRHATLTTTLRKSSHCSQGTVEPLPMATSLQRPFFWRTVHTLTSVKNSLQGPLSSVPEVIVVERFNWIFFLVVMPCTLPCLFCTCLLENGSGTVFPGVAGICQEWDRSE